MRIPYLSICAFLWLGKECVVQAEEPVPDNVNSQSQQPQNFNAGFQFQLGEVEESPGWTPPKNLDGWGWNPGKQQEFGWKPTQGWGWPVEQKGWTPEPHHHPHHHHHHHHHKKGKGKRRPKKGKRRGKKKGHKKGKKGPPRLKFFPPSIKFIPPRIRLERPRIVVRRPKLKFIKG